MTSGVMPEELDARIASGGVISSISANSLLLKSTRSGAFSCTFVSIRYRNTRPTASFHTFTRTQRSRIFTRGQFLVYSIRGGERAFLTKVQIGVGFRILRLRKLECGLRQFDGAELAFGKPVANLLDGERRDACGCRAHRSITLGTL